MKNLKSIYALIFLIFIISSCYKDKLIGEYYLPYELKAQNPFYGYETLHFINGSGEIIELTAEERVNELRKYYQDHTQSDYILVEYDYIQFENESNSMRLNMNGSITGSEPQGLGFYLKYKAHECWFGSGYILLSNDSSIKVIDSLLVNGSWIQQIYYDTMEYDHTQPFPEELQVIPIKSYYSTSLGVVKIDFSDGSTWELDEIIW